MKEKAIEILRDALNDFEESARVNANGSPYYQVGYLEASIRDALKELEKD